MIEPLSTIESFNAPQLDYLKKGWDPAIVQQFIDRYNYGHVGQKDKLDSYLNDQPIQKVLEVYRLDPEKFWYFLLFATDYAEGMGSFFSHNPSPLVQFEKVFPLIEANLQPHVFPQGGYVFKDDPNMKLTLTEVWSQVADVSVGHKDRHREIQNRQVQRAWQAID